MSYRESLWKIPELLPMLSKWVLNLIYNSTMEPIEYFGSKYFLENYHRLHALLSQLKISVLESEKKEAKQRYQEALQSYVILYFGRPLEKLNVTIIYNLINPFVSLYLTICSVVFRWSPNESCPGR